MGIMDDGRIKTQPLSKFWYKGKVTGIDMVRLDTLHPVVSGNKWFKLRLNLSRAADTGKKTVVTFGGAYSNHLVATACAAQHFRLASVGIVRGSEDQITPTLQQCRDFGMQLIFVSHGDYRNRNQPQWGEALVAGFDDPYIIPEGGANERGRAGAGLLTRYITADYTHIALCVGTGTTLAGIRNALSTSQTIIGFVPMKQSDEQHQYISENLSENRNHDWTLINDTYFGGFGKWNDSLLQFMNEFHDDNKIPLDIIYTSKMMYNLQQMLADNYFSSCDKILCIHSGGLQGNASVRDSLRY
jgi:1-aminocyclopropane-1-carboxylate deaminase